MRTALFMAALAVLPDIASAQTEVRSPGRAYVNLGLQYQSSDRFFSAEGESRTGRTLEQVIVSAYGEVGIVERWLMLTLSADLLRRNVLVEQGATTGLGDLRIGAWTQWASFGSFRLLSALQIGLPSGDPEPRSDDQDEVNALVARTLPTGDGEWDLEPSLALAGNIGGAGYPLRHYVLLQGGYWLRTSDFVDAASYRAEIGSQIAAEGWDRVWLIARLRGVEAFDVPGGGGASAGVGLGNGISFTLLGAEAQVRLPFNLGVGLGFDAPVRGAGILDAAALRASFSVEI